MENTKKRAVESVDALAPVLTKLADEIWDHPECSLKEHFAAQRYCETLQTLGFQVERGLGGIETAFSGKFGSGKPVIGILGEFDALSGLSQTAGETHPHPEQPGGNGHGCGHNLLGVGALAAACAVKRYLEQNSISGTVIFYGCPGEEGGSAKAFLARERLWSSLDAAISWHPSAVNQVRTGTNNSSIQVLYKFHGVASHAAGSPELGRSALDAVELMNIGVQFLREHMTDDCRIHYAIVNSGGISPNVVQSEAEVLYMTRANRVRDCVKLQERVDKIAAGAAMMTETTYDRVFIDGTAELLPNHSLERVLYRNFEEIGVPTHTDEEFAFSRALRATYPVEACPPGVGAAFDAGIADMVREKTGNMTAPLNDFLMPLYSGTGFVAGSTDLGDVSWLTPTAQIEVVTWPAGCPDHTWQVVTCGKSSLAHKGMLCAGKVLAATAIDLLTDPEALAAAREEFSKKSVSGYVCPIEPGAVPIAL